MRNSPIPLNIIEPTFDIHSSLSSCASSTSSTWFSSSLSKSSLLLFTHQQHQHRQQQQENFVLATSAANQLQQHAGSLDTFVLPSDDKSSRDAAAGETSSQLCNDQKGFLDHLKPRSLFISTLRVSTLQISQILTSYVTDQIHHESSLDRELEDGKISVSELDLQKLQWEEIEWSKRWKTFPHKLRIALVKYHALVLTMRFYEYMIGKCVKDGRFLLDRLTKDSFKVAIVKSRRLEEPSLFILREKSSEKSYALEMFETCIYSNAISFLADYSIQQSILIYGYYLYVKNVQRKNKLQRFRLQRQLEEDEQKEEEEDDDDDDDEEEEDDDEEEEEHQQEQNQIELNVSTDFPSHDIVPRHYQSGGLVLSFMYKSSQLLVSRAIGLFMAGVGGALGSLIRPGWGTVVGAQLGDACVGALLDNH